jgi:hypothetical protein
VRVRKHGSADEPKRETFTEGGFEWRGHTIEGHGRWGFLSLRFFGFGERGNRRGALGVW